MNLSTELLIAALVVASVVLQFGQHRLSLWRLLLPVVIVGFFATRYLTGFPTEGNDLIFELVGAGIGVVCGVAAGALLGVRRDVQGRVLVTAGIANIALWVAIFGARLVFAWFATNSASFDHALGVFSHQHQITGQAAWTAFFILQAILMIAVRTVFVGARALVAARDRETQLAA
jgi:hypothetical protein